MPTTGKARQFIQRLRLSQHFGDAQQWAPHHFGTVAVGDVRRQRRVWEEGSTLEWPLLCELGVTTFAQARERAWQYATRWLMEEFHKALKMGLGAERLQVHTGHRLVATVSLLSVVALALVDIREQGRQQPDSPAEAAGLPPPYLQVLRCQ